MKEAADLASDARVEEDDRWMSRALAAARRAARRGEVPVGAVVVGRGGFLASGGNRSISARDPSGHAEIVALRNAARRTGNHRLGGATLFVTLEPCVMCLGAIVQARVARLVYAAKDPKSGALGLLANPDLARLQNHRFAVEGGVRSAEAASILKAFFKARRGRRT
jgi:tRNA(adenine34) deaminase